MSRTHITITLRNVYGETKAYPTCPTAKLFAKIAGTKTLTIHTLAKIMEMGYAIRDQYGRIVENVSHELTVR